MYLNSYFGKSTLVIIKALVGCFNSGCCNGPLHITLLKTVLYYLVKVELMFIELLNKLCLLPLL